MQDGEDQLRLCRDCEQSLSRRDEQMELRAQPPIIQQMYERLKGLMVDAGNIYPNYILSHGRVAWVLNFLAFTFSLTNSVEP